MSPSPASPIGSGQNGGGCGGAPPPPCDDPCDEPPHWVLRYSHSVSDVHTIARRQMTAAGHMYTRGRQALVDLLAGTGAPATIPMIMERSTDLAQSSLYRNLSVMEQVGIVTRVDVGDTKSYYELSELVTDDHHHHLVCNRCTAVVDVSLPARAEQNIEHALDDAARDAGFELTNHRVDIIGICPDCRAA